MSKETIVLVGVCDKPESTNVAQAKYFERLGYEVIPINYRTVISNYSLSFFENLLMHVVETNKPKLVFFSKCNGIHSEIIKWCSDRVVVFYWFMDYTHNITSEIMKHVEYATFASATSSEVVDIFKQVNSNTHWIIEGYDPEICFYEELTPIYNTVFIGNATPKRIEQLKGSDVTIFGSGWPKEFNANPPVYGHEFRKVVCQSKFVLNLVHGNIFSNRVVDSLACGTDIHSEWCKDLSTVFPTAYMYKRFLLLTLKDVKIERYTWENTLKKVMEIIENG